MNLAAEESRCDRDVGERAELSFGLLVGLAVGIALPALAAIRFDDGGEEV